jgi:hypothetical protein
MQLGSLAPTSNEIGIVAESNFDFTPLGVRIVKLEERQQYLMYALVLLALYTILKK